MLFDRVEQTTTTTGTGALSLISPVTAARRSFVQAAGSGSQVFYVIDFSSNDPTLDGLYWEMGIGTCTAGTPDTLTRSTVLLSSNSNSLVNFPTGTKRVYCALPQSCSGFGTTRLTSTWGGSQAATGWQRLPTGVIVQWGTTTNPSANTGTDYGISFPIAFPNNCFPPIVCNGDFAGQSVGVGSTFTTTFFYWRTGTSGAVRVNWLALGN